MVILENFTIIKLRQHLEAILGRKKHLKILRTEDKRPIAYGYESVNLKPDSPFKHLLISYF